MKPNVRAFPPVTALSANWMSNQNPCWKEKGDGWRNRLCLKLLAPPPTPPPPPQGGGQLDISVWWLNGRVNLSNRTCGSLEHLSGSCRGQNYSCITSPDSPSAFFFSSSNDKHKKKNPTRLSLKMVSGVFLVFTKSFIEKSEGPWCRYRWGIEWD